MPKGQKKKKAASLCRLTVFLFPDLNIRKIQTSLTGYCLFLLNQIESKFLDVADLLGIYGVFFLINTI